MLNESFAVDDSGSECWCRESATFKTRDFELEEILFLQTNKNRSVYNFSLKKTVVRVQLLGQTVEKY